jgi:hypothetical protein
MVHAQVYIIIRQTHPPLSATLSAFSSYVGLSSGYLYHYPVLPMCIPFQPDVTGLTLEGNSGEEVALWLLTSLCTSAKREVEVALNFTKSLC